MLAWSPMEFTHSCFVRHPVDMDLLRQCTTVLSGTHNYFNFSTAVQPWQNPVKTVSIDVRPGRGLLQEHSPFFRDQFDHWDVCFSSKSYLQKQIRKMMAVILGVATGRLEIAVVKDMLDQSERVQLRDTDIYQIPPHALYLTDVQYDDEDLQFEPTENIDDLDPMVDIDDLQPS